MKAIKFTAVLCLSLLSYASVAQTKFKCDEAFKVFEQKLNAGDYAAAYADMPALRKNCKGLNENVYRYSEIVLKSKQETSNDAEEKNRLTAELVDIYTEYDKYYPNSGAAVKKAMLQYKNKLAENEEVYAVLDAAFTKNSNSFNEPEAIETYFILYMDKFKAGSDKFTSDDLVLKYGAVSAQARMAADNIEKKRQVLIKKQETESLSNNEKLSLSAYESDVETLKAVSENIDILASKHLSCAKLEDYYKKEFEVNASNISWLQAMVTTMMNNRCFNANVTEQGALALHKLMPSAETAFDLATVYQRKNDVKKAAEYFEQSAQLETNLKKKSEIYYRVASAFRNSDKAMAKKYALMAA